MLIPKLNISQLFKYRYHKMLSFKQLLMICAHKLTKSVFVSNQFFLTASRGPKKVLK